MQLPLGVRFQRFFHSVRFRLTLWFVVILALVLLVFSVFIYTRQIQVVRAETAIRLSAQSAQLGEYFSQKGFSQYESENEGESLQVVPTDNLPLIQEDEILAIFDSEGHLVQETGNITETDLQQSLQSLMHSSSFMQPVILNLKDGGQAYMLILTSFNSEHAPKAFLLFGAAVDPNNQLPELAVTLVLSSTVILILAFGGGYWLADRAMNPVQVITRTAREIGAGDLSRRLRMKQIDELGELAETFDQMLDRLQSAFERQRQFTNDASHELRTPLSIIELETNRALERRRTIGEYRKALAVIQVENEWMSSLVNELLTLARFDAGQVIKSNKILDLIDLVLEVIERLEILAQEKGISLIAGSLSNARVYGDVGYLSQMLINLLENAIKHTQNKGTQVLVDTGIELREGQPGGWVKITDNGPGIPVEHLPHVFDRFYRVDTARSRDEESLESVASGSGLGLAIVQSIIKAHGGFIEVHSELGKGTVFKVWLPGPG